MQKEEIHEGDREKASNIIKNLVFKSKFSNYEDMFSK